MFCFRLLFWVFFRYRYVVFILIGVEEVKGLIICGDLEFKQSFYGRICQQEVGLGVDFYNFQKDERSSWSFLDLGVQVGFFEEF